MYIPAGKCLHASAVYGLIELCDKFVANTSGIMTIVTRRKNPVDQDNQIDTGLKTVRSCFIWMFSDFHDQFGPGNIK